jgi:predicted small lipoprotein YifL
MINKQRILGAAQGMSRPLLIAAMFTTGLLVSACGQKGPLYLPPPEAKAAITAPVPGDTAGPVEKTTK